jgi:hypothetical protein
MTDEELGPLLVEKRKREAAVVGDGWRLDWREVPDLEEVLASVSELVAHAKRLKEIRDLTG